ncbi:MAG: hypothetical protein JO131_03580, partial [Gammaproteobacteria bacterium]|nr:hypothetical protein [Gammaproteobacteria bacterium]
MQRLTRNKEIKQPNSEISFPSLNGGQRNVIEGTLNFYLDDIHDLTKEGSERKLHPLNALKALKKMLNTEPLNEEEVKQFTKHDILTNITVVRDILNHPYPQNRTHSYFPTGEKDFVLFHLNPDDCDKLLDKQATLNTKRTIQTEDQTRVVYDVIYKNGRKIPANLTHSLTSLDSLGIEWDFIGKEPIGKLSLTNLEDAKTLPVTKQAVVDYIHFLVKKAIKFQEMQYIEDIKKFLQIKSFIKIIHADTILEIAKEGGVECAIFLLKTQGIIEKLEYSHLKKIESFYPNTTVSVFLKTVVYKNYFNMLVNSDRFNLNTLRKVTEILNKCEA